METLFPSLLHLEAPDFVCGSVMRSTLAGQLQSLNINDLDSPPAGPNLDTISHASKIMPNVRKLVIDGDRNSPFKATTLNTLLRCVPGVEELELCWELDEPDKILSALQLVPNLRVLNLYFFPLSWVESSRDWDKCIPILAQTCPKLRWVNKLHPAALGWEICHGEDGTIIVSDSY
ncbi:hypothetical protein FS749_000164 [Ceratobasidium sp. UAMH 11750]|nr:hypothetical protein FS749_000164 [Ceratobasidium sp. UAMH 11750]